MRLKIFERISLRMPRLLLPAVLLTVLSTAVFADKPDREFTKTYNREFSTTEKGMTALYNKYGNVNVKTWNDNKVKIDITILVNANDQKEADKIFERIQVNFTNTAGYIKAETMLNQNKDWWPAIKNPGQDFKINYEVWMPVNNQLDLKNRYGNCYVSNLNGKLNAEVKYGDLRTETLGADADLYMGYGKAYIAKVNNVYGQISYGELNLKDARDLQLDTHYSDLNIDKAEDMRVTSKYDDFTLGTIDNLKLQTKYATLKIQKVRVAYLTAGYTDTKIGSLGELVDADLTYGSFKIEALSRNFSDVNVVGKYTDVIVVAEQGANLRFDAEGSYCDLRYPNTATIRKHNDKGGYEVVNGYLGDANAKGIVKVKLNYGDFVLKR
jgi:uncharacterized lipoprotein YehR (DUF1307 family)